MTSTFRRSSSDDWVPPDVKLKFSEREDGDFHLDQDPAALDDRRRRFVDLPWSQPDEVHGIGVGVVRHPGDSDRLCADALVTDCDRAVIGIWVGDCAPVALVSESGRIAGVHAGWRGLRDGVVARAVDAVRRFDGERVRGFVGPCIHACCYEFGTADLATMTNRFGESVAGSSSAGSPALDMPRAILRALDEVGVDADCSAFCTGCVESRFFSHRVRREGQRQVMAVWKA